MRINKFEWDEDNVNHIAKHSVKPAEVEEVCFFRPLIMKGRFGRYFILGQSEAGRYLAIVIEYKGRGIARVITARDMDETERRSYRKR